VQEELNDLYGKLYYKAAVWRNLRQLPVVPVNYSFMKVMTAAKNSLSKQSALNLNLGLKCYKH